MRTRHNEHADSLHVVMCCRRATHGWHAAKSTAGLLLALQSSNFESKFFCNGQWFAVCYCCGRWSCRFNSIGIYAIGTRLRGVLRQLLIGLTTRENRAAEKRQQVTQTVTSPTHSSHGFNSRKRASSRILSASATAGFSCMLPQVTRTPKDPAAKPSFERCKRQKTGQIHAQRRS